MMQDAGTVCIMIPRESTSKPNSRDSRGLKHNFSVATAADYMGISQRLLRELIASGQIRHVRIGRRVILRHVDLDRFLADHAVGG